jgi:alkylation response protein AidB-like acyl-CoA dehydrogenase
MHFAFTEEQEELRRGARRFLAAASSPARVRAAMQTAEGYEADVWRRVAGELGWPALIVPEEYGGCGATYVELVAVMEEMGRALVCSPFFASVCLGANAILAAGSDAQKRALLPAIASGERTATLAVSEPGRDDGAIATIARPDGASFVLTGEKRFVVDGHTAGLLVVAARLPGTAGDRGVALFAVPADATGIERRLLATMDMTRKQAAITLRDVRVPASALLGDAGAGGAALQKTLDLARVALAAEQVGGAQRCLEMAVDYAKVRMQFGRPIGSFQAIKHKCADMMVAVEAARSASYYAGWVAAHEPSELRAAAAMAKATCSDAFFQCAAENIQVHGGIGCTWEHDAHLYFKRAKSSESLLGDPAYHREVTARLMGLGEVTG